MTQSSSSYEFGTSHEEVFAKLASAMVFVGIAMLIPGAVLGVAAVLLRRTLFGAGICGVLAILIVAMGLLQYRAAGHFRRIVSTRGRDVDNLMIALGELTSVYQIERWLWIALAAGVVIALAAGAVAG